MACRWVLRANEQPFLRSLPPLDVGMTAVWLYNLTGPEKISVRELNSWLDCLRDVLAPSTSNFHLMVAQSPLQLLSSSSSFPALSLVSTGAQIRSLTLEYTYASEVEGALMGIEPLILRPAVV